MMNTYNPNRHHRRSIRLKGYDYSQAGLYFLTICVQNREHLFGQITNAKMQINDAGKMIEKWYDELENKFSDIKCHQMVVMPNHFHCIIQNVGADLRVCPICPVCPDITDEEMGEEMGEHVGSPQRDSPQRDSPQRDSPQRSDSFQGEHAGSPQRGSSLHRVVQWFKTMTTNEYIRNVKSNDWQRFDGKLWQRNYYEHIIRNDKSYQAISQYIINNPSQWNNDKLNAINT